jgi:hypothetical protein
MKKTQKSMFIKLGASLVVVAMLALVLGTFTYVKADGNPNDYAVRSLATYLDSHPDSQVAVLLAKIVLSLNGVDNNAIGAYRAAPGSDESPVYKLAYRIGQSNLAIVEGWYRGDMPSVATSATTVTATTSDYWCNDLGVDADVMYGYIKLTGTVSSTFNLYMATSSANSLPLYTTVPFSTIIDAKQVVTSTASITRLYNSFEDQGTNGSQSTVVATGECVLVKMKNLYNDGCTGALCESVTSSARGWVGTWGFKYKYIKNL